MDWPWLLKTSRPVFDGFVKMETKKWEFAGTILELLAETGKLGRAITIFEGYRQGKKSRHDLADELSDILFVLCRFSYAGYIELTGRLLTGYADSSEEAYFRICLEASLLNKDYNQRKFHEALTSVQTIASLVVWLANRYGINLELVHLEEMANAAAFQQLFYDSTGRKKNGNFITNKFRLIHWFFIVKNHEKKVEKI